MFLGCELLMSIDLPIYNTNSDFLTMEHIDNDNSIYTSLSFKPLNTFDITFSAIIQPEVSSNRYVTAINSFR